MRGAAPDGVDAPSPREAALLAEIDALAATLSRVRAEVSALQADDITASHIPSATDELDAIVSHTATATHGILECCEAIEAVMDRLGKQEALMLQGPVTRIYEACSFQDITGQRVGKVVAALQAIERLVVQMIGVFAPSSGSAARQSPALQLLNGPQRAELAMGQSDIDALLASFD